MLARIILLILLFALLLESGRAEDVVPRTPIGSKIPNLTFKDTRYLERQLSELGEQTAYVIVCTNTTCPLVQRYLPKLKRLAKQYRESKVQFLALNVAATESIGAIAFQSVEAEADFPFVQDISNRCVRALGVRRTPEVCVLDASFHLRYRGRIDDQYRIGGARPRVANDDLVNALDAILAGDEPPILETNVDGCLISPAPKVGSDQSLGYGRDIAPLIQKHCVECHRGGTEAPFKLTRYEDVSQHAEMIAEVVSDQRMPPWYASPADEQFANHRGMTPRERRTLLQWVRAGMPEGEPIEQTEPPVVDRWLIGKPDRIIRTIETHTLPAEGYIPYKYSVLPTVFLHDTWLRSIQIVADNPRVLHHCNLICMPLGGSRDQAYFVTGKVPGAQPLEVDNGVGILIPRGSILLLQIHYTTTGKEELCQISVGVNYAKGTIQKRFRHLLVKNTKFSIPPQTGNHRVEKSETLDRNTTGIGLFTHMHVRGKDMTFYATTPAGNRERLLTVPNYNFDWQMGYRWPADKKRFPAGTKFECVAHFDNSSFNPYNPDPNATVREGPQTYHEMMYGFYFYTDDDEQLNLQIDPKTGQVIKPEDNQDATK